MHGATMKFHYPV